MSGRVRQPTGHPGQNSRAPHDSCPPGRDAAARAYTQGSARGLSAPEPRLHRCTGRAWQGWIIAEPQPEHVEQLYEVCAIRGALGDRAPRGVPVHEPQRGKEGRYLRRGEGVFHDAMPPQAASPRRVYCSSWPAKRAFCWQGHVNTWKNWTGRWNGSNRDCTDSAKAAAGRFRPNAWRSVRPRPPASAARPIRSRRLGGGGRATVRAPSR